MSQKNRIYILAGQSWINGQVSTMSELQVGYKDIYQMNSRIWQGSTFEPIYSPDNNNQYPIANRSNGCSVECYFKDIADNYGNDVYILKVAQGSTRLQEDVGRTDWNVNSENELADDLLAQITSIKSWMTARGKEYEFVCILWWQGEGDSFIESASLVYQQNLQDLYDAINLVVGSTLPIFQYNIVPIPSGTDRDYLTNVNNAKTAFTDIDPTKRFLFNVGTVNFQSDGIHPTVDDYKRIWDDIQKPLILNNSN